MATYYNHCQVGIVDASGNVNVIYPQTYASDVKVGTANSSIGITTSSTVQSLISKLGSAATKNVGDLVTNSASSSSTSQAYSCNQINSKLNELNSKIQVHDATINTFVNSNLIKGTIRDTSVKNMVIGNIIPRDGTPYPTTYNIFASCDTNNIYFYAVGAGYVNGHMIVIKYIILH